MSLDAEPDAFSPGLPNALTLTSNTWAQLMDREHEPPPVSWAGYAG